MHVVDLALIFLTRYSNSLCSRNVFDPRFKPTMRRSEREPDDDLVLRQFIYGDILPTPYSLIPGSKRRLAFKS